MDSDDDFDPDFLTAIDQLVAQHHTKNTQQPPVHQRSSQPVSPLPVPPARHQQPYPPPAQAGNAGLAQQQPAPGPAPLQQINGVSAGAHGNGQLHKPPLIAGRPLGQHPHPQQQPGQPAAFGQGGVPPGRVTLAAAELQAQAAAAVQQQVWHGQGAVPAGGPPGPPVSDPQARLAQVLSELSRSEGQNKLLASNLQQKERELSLLRQKAAQLERGSGTGGGASGRAAGAGGGPVVQRSAFAVGEVQKQLESLRQQLMFKEQEMDDLKRQHSERTERLRAAESSIAELKGQLRQAATSGQQEQQQQQANGTAGAAGGAALGATEPAASSAAAAAAPHERPRSAGRMSSAAAAQTAQRSSGQKRRAAGASDAAATAAATERPLSPASAAGTAAAAAPAAVSTAPLQPPLLDPAVLAAASGLGGSARLMTQLMAACGGSMALLVGAAPGEGHPAEAAAPTTALLLRARLAAVAQGPDGDSLQFVASFSQRVQQAACGMLPPAALLDSIAALAAASLARLHGSSGGGSGGLPQQRLRLLSAGLNVAQHLIEGDRGCAAAALASPGSSRGSGGSGGSSLASLPRLSSRVSLLGSAGSAVPDGAVPAVPAPAHRLAWPAPSSSSSDAGLPATAAALQQHAAVFGGLTCGSSPVLPVLVGAALWLGPHHEAVAAGALGCLVALARGLQGEGARAVMAPVFTTGAMELLMQPPPLRLQALRLLHLLLEEPALARLFEESLAQAALARCEPGPPTAGNSNSGGSNGMPGPAAGGAGGGPQPMQLEGSAGRGGEEEAGRGGPWIGAARIAELLLDCFALEDGALPAAEDSSGAAAAAAAAAAAGSAAAGAGVSGGSSGLAGSGGTAVARAAMQVVASLREARRYGILVPLVLDEAFGAPGCVLAQRLVQLAESTMAQPGEEAAMMLLCPVQWPDGSSSSPGSGGHSSGGGGGGSGLLLHQQAAWWERLRVAQEALTLLRGLLIDDSCGVAAMDDMASIAATARFTLTTLSRLSRLEAPLAAAGGAAAAAAAGRAPGGTSAAARKGGAAAGAAAAGGYGGIGASSLAALSPPPALLAPWARAIGSSSDQPSNDEGAAAGALPVCRVEDVVYMAKSMRRRVLARMQSAAMQQG